MDDTQESPDLLSSLQKGIERRQQELHNVAEIIAKNANSLSRIANLTKSATVLLGGIAATKGVADTLFGADSTLNLVVFSLIGVVIAANAGIEAAFKFDRRGTELTLLAATCQSTVREVDTEWRKSIGSVYDSDLRQAAGDLITKADQQLTKVQEDAAKLGVNITLRASRNRVPRLTRTIQALIALGAGVAVVARIGVVRVRTRTGAGVAGGITCVIRARV